MEQTKNKKQTCIEERKDNVEIVLKVLDLNNKMINFG